MISIRYNGVEISVENPNDVASIVRGLSEKQEKPVVSVATIRRPYRRHRRSPNPWTKEELEYLFKNRFVKPRFLARDSKLAKHTKLSIAAMARVMITGSTSVYNTGKDTFEFIKALRAGENGSTRLEVKST